jgi:hypothetical protein
LRAQGQAAAPLAKRPGAMPTCRLNAVLNVLAEA